MDSTWQGKHEIMPCDHGMIVPRLLKVRWICTLDLSRILSIGVSKMVLGLVLSETVQFTGFNFRHAVLDKEILDCFIHADFLKLLNLYTSQTSCGFLPLEIATLNRKAIIFPDYKLF